jgi:hypothetical protein
MSRPPTAPAAGWASQPFPNSNYNANPVTGQGQSFDIHGYFPRIFFTKN